MTPYIILGIIAVGMGLAGWLALRWDHENDDRPHVR